MVKCIRALCNADIKEGFVLGQNVSLPQTYVHLARNPPSIYNFPSVYTIEAIFILDSYVQRADFCLYKCGHNYVSFQYGLVLENNIPLTRLYLKLHNTCKPQNTYNFSSVSK